MSRNEKPHWLLDSAIIVLAITVISYAVGYEVEGGAASVYGIPLEIVKLDAGILYRNGTFILVLYPMMFLVAMNRLWTPFSHTEFLRINDFSEVAKKNISSLILQMANIVFVATYCVKELWHHERNLYSLLELLFLIIALYALRLWGSDVLIRIAAWLLSEPCKASALKSKMFGSLLLQLMYVAVCMLLLFPLFVYLPIAVGEQIASCYSERYEIMGERCGNFSQESELALRIFGETMYSRCVNRKTGVLRNPLYTDKFRGKAFRKVIVEQPVHLQDSTDFVSCLRPTTGNGVASVPTTATFSVATPKPNSKEKQPDAEMPH